MGEDLILYGVSVASTVAACLYFRLRKRFSFGVALAYSSAAAAIPYFLANTLMFGVGVYSAAALLMGFMFAAIFSAFFLTAIEGLRVISRYVR